MIDERVGFFACSGSTGEEIAAPTGTAKEVTLDVVHVGLGRRKLSGAVVVGHAATRIVCARRLCM